MQRRALELGVARPAPPPKHVRQDGVVYPERTPREGAVSQEQLIRAVRDGRQRFQNFGGQMMQGYLASIGVHATWEQVKQARLVVDGVPQALGNQRIQRQQYRVAAPNSLWHGDGQHCEKVAFIWIISDIYVSPSIGQIWLCHTCLH